jgi:hypothetical protein
MHDQNDERVRLRAQAGEPTMDNELLPEYSRADRHFAPTRLRR